MLLNNNDDRLARYTYIFLVMVKQHIVANQNVNHESILHIQVVRTVSNCIGGIQPHFHLCIFLWGSWMDNKLTTRIDIWILDMVTLAANYYIVEKISKFKYFLYIFIESSHLRGDLYSLYKNGHGHSAFLIVNITLIILLDYKQIDCFIVVHFHFDYTMHIQELPMQNKHNLNLCGNVL